MVAPHFGLPEDTKESQYRGHLGALLGPRLGGWRFDLSLDVGAIAHHMFFRSVFLAD